MYVGLDSVFPPFGLLISTSRVALRPITDEVLADLIQVAQQGIHDRGVMPFFYPWTEASGEELAVGLAQYHWALRAGWNRECWTLDLAIEYEGEIVGIQGISSDNYLATRTCTTGSWIGMKYQGQRIGTRSRQAICAFCFDHLDAEWVVSEAYEDNSQSLAVSRRVGYVSNGVRRRLRGSEDSQLSREMVLTADRFNRGDPITVSGISAFRKFVGLDS